MSTLKTTNLQHASAASPAIVLAADGSATAQLSSLNGGALAGARNRIINGDMRIDQRNAGASISNAAASLYCLDRWGTYGSLASKFTVQRSTTAPAGFSNSLLITTSSAHTVAADQVFSVYQNIEGFNTSDLSWGTASAKTVTLSFWVRSSLTGTFCGAINNSAQDRSYVFSYAISSANTWTQIGVTVPGDTTGTWFTANEVGLTVLFGLGIGSNYNTVAGSWVAGAKFSTTGATSVVGTNGATFYITGVQLEAGTVATPFERRSYGQELALCQRYYESTTTSVVMWPPVSNNAANIAARRAWVPFLVAKRATPSVTVSKSQGLTSEFVGSYTNGFSYSGDQGAFLETVVTSWTASIEL